VHLFKGELKKGLGGVVTRGKITKAERRNHSDIRLIGRLHEISRFRGTKNHVSIFGKVSLCHGKRAENQWQVKYILRAVQQGV